MIVPTSNSVNCASDEQSLLDQLIVGDRDAFWPLWDKYQDYLFSRCQAWMGGDYLEAEEALSLIALKAWQKLPEHAPTITNLKGWLNRLAHNLCVDLHRQRQRQAIGIENIEEHPNIVQPIEDLSSIIASSNNPETALLQEEFKAYLQLCIEQLPHQLREPVKLRYYQGMSCIEIGELLGIRQNTVSKRLQKARLALKKLISAYSSGLGRFEIEESSLREISFEKPKNQDVKNPVQINSTMEEISYRVTISCLETLSPTWFSSPLIAA